MTSIKKDKDLDPSAAQPANVPLSGVEFHLDESHHLDEFDESLDEVDEFLELSTMSNPPYTSSFDSTNGLSHEKKSAPKQYSR